MAVMPPKVLRTPLHSRMAGASADGGIRFPGSAMTRAEDALACTCRSVGPASGVTTVPSTEPAPAMKTERRMSGRSSRSRVRPLKRTSPFSKKTARSASSSATFTDCSTTTIVVPVACNSLTTSSNWATTVGASPSESSSIMSTLGFTMSAMASDSICCSPPERLPACWWPRSRRIGKRSSTRVRGLGHGVVILADHPGTETQVLVHRQGREHAPATGHQRQAPARHRLGGLAGDGGAVHPHGAAAHLDQTAGALQQGGLAGTVGAEQRHDLALVHIEIDPEEDLHRAVGDLDLLARQHHGAVRDEPVGMDRRAGDETIGTGAVSSSRVSGTGTNGRRTAPGGDPLVPRVALLRLDSARAPEWRSPPARGRPTRPGGRPPGWAPGSGAARPPAAAAGPGCSARLRPTRREGRAGRAAARRR